MDSFLAHLIDQVQAWLGSLSVLFLLYGAYLLWTSGDNPQQRSRAWRHLATVVAGIILILFAKDIIRLLYSWAGQSAPF
jgi:Na+-transporting NADH:ubiquinone oxidoreductase subunit NqrB